MGKLDNRDLKSRLKEKISKGVEILISKEIINLKYAIWSYKQDTYNL